MIDFKVDLADFNRQLSELKAEFQRNAVKLGVAAAGRAFRDIARTRAPILDRSRGGKSARVSGALRKNIYSGIPRGQTPGQVRAIVSVRAGRKSQRGKAENPFYWGFLEGGWIPRGPGNRLRGGRRTKALARERNAISKIAYPFMRPAFESGKSQAVAAFEKRIAAAIAKFSKL